MTDKFVEHLGEQIEDWVKRLDGSDSEKLKVIGEIMMASYMTISNMGEDIALIRDLLTKKTK